MILQNKFKTVLTYGTFDLLHYGHLEILKRAKDYGHKLIVGLSTDEFNKVKGKTCKFNYNKRKRYLESLDFVDLVIPEDNWEQKSQDVIEHRVDFFVMGDDWKDKFNYLEEFCDVIYLPRTKGVSTSQLKQLLNNG
nr:glycerol-3-phosphate cytidylyltransferase [uncultured Winogradskyella sp.]